jgi:hypothetical protein
MTKHRRLPLTALVATLAALALPGAADADTYCVNESPCLFGAMEPTIQSALDAAEQHPGADTVRIGPSSVPYNEGPLVYLKPASNPVRIVGAGASDTGLTSTNAGVDVLTLGPGSTVEGLKIAVVPGVSNAGGLRLLGASARSISVTYQGDEPNAVGIRTEEDAELEDVTVSMKTALAFTRVFAADGFIGHKDHAVMCLPGETVVGGGHGLPEDLINTGPGTYVPAFAALQSRPANAAGNPAVNGQQPRGWYVKAFQGKDLAGAVAINVLCASAYAGTTCGAAGPAGGPARQARSRDHDTPVNAQPHHRRQQ